MDPLIADETVITPAAQLILVEDSGRESLKNVASKVGSVVDTIRRNHRFDETMTMTMLECYVQSRGSDERAP